MNVEYKARITGDISSLEKVLKKANGSMKQLTDKDFIIKLDYDGNVKALNKTLTEALKACPDLAIQFQYDVNKKALEQKLNEIQSIESFKVDIDTGKVKQKVREMVSDIQTGFDSHLDTEEVTKKKIDDLYRYVNTAAKAGTDVSDSLSDLDLIDKELGGFLTTLSKTPKYLFDMSDGIDGALKKTRNEIEQIKQQLSFFESKGANTKAIASDAKESSKEISELSEELEELAENIELAFKDAKLGKNTITQAKQITDATREYWKEVKQAIDDGDESAKEFYKTLGLLNKEGTLDLITSGNKNIGGVIGEDRVAIARKNKEGVGGYEDTLAVKKKLDEAYASGIQVARILDVIGDKQSDTFLEIQEKAQGQTLATYWNHTLSGVDEVNTAFFEATEDQIRKLIQDLLELQKLGINAELNPENILFDKTKGFTIIDLDSRVSSYTSAANLVEDASERIIGEVEQMYDAMDGKDREQGLAMASDFKKKFDTIAKAMAEVVDTAEKATEEAQDSHSPSKVAEKLGEKWGVGYAEGIKKHKGDVEDAVRELVKAGELKMRDLVEDLPNIVGNAEYVDLENPVKNILANGKESAVSPTQEFDNEIQKNLTYLENYRNTIKEIDRLKLEPETDETKKKLEELNTLADYFASHITVIRSENQNEVDRSMMRFGYDWNENLRRNYTEEQRKAFYEIAGEKTGLRTNQEVPQFHYIKDELKSIESQSEKTRQSLNETLANSASYVKHLKSDFLDLIDTKLELKVETNKRDIELYEKDIANILKKYPELEQFLDKFTSFGAAKKFAQSDEWNDFLATLPQARAYLESIGYSFESVSEAERNVGDSSAEASQGVEKAEDSIEEESQAAKEATKNKEDLADAEREVANESEHVADVVGELPRAFEETTGETSRIESMADAERELAGAIEEVGENAKESAEDISKIGDPAAVRENGLEQAAIDAQNKYRESIKATSESLREQRNLEQAQAVNEQQHATRSANISSVRDLAMQQEIADAQKKYKASIQATTNAIIEQTNAERNLEQYARRIPMTSEEAFQQLGNELSETNVKTKELEASLKKAIDTSKKADSAGSSLELLNSLRQEANKTGTDMNKEAADAYKQLTRNAQKYYELEIKAAKNDLTGTEKQRLEELRKEWNDATAAVGKYKTAAGSDDSISKLGKARDAFNNSDTVSAIKESRNLAKTEQQLRDYARSGKYVKELNVELENVADKIAKINEKAIDLKSEDDIKKIGELNEEIQKTLDKVDAANTRRAKDSSIAKLNLQIEEFIQKNSKMGEKFKAEFQNLKLDWDLEHTNAELEELVAKFAKLKGKVTAAGKLGASFLDTIKERLVGVNAQLIAQYLSLQDIIRYVQTLARNVIAVDTALTELRKVSDASTGRLQQSFEASAKAAQDLGHSITDIINSTSDWSRAGFDIDAAEELARVSTLYQNVGDNIDAATANEHLVSALRSFHKNAEDAERIVDVYNEVANKFSIDTAGIGEALQRSASVFYNASTDLESAVALVTGANEIVQDPSRVGNAWKTISARIRASKNELVEMGEETEDMFESTAKLQDYLISMTGVDILDDKGQFKNLKDIVIELGKAFETIDNEFVKQEVAEKLAGKTQMNVLLSAISNYKQIEKAYDTATKAAGSAAREQENYSQSIEYSIKQLQGSVEELSYDLLNKDLVKNAVDLVNTIVQGLDSIIEKSDRLVYALGGISGVLMTIKKVGVSLNYDKNKDAFSWSILGSAIPVDEDLNAIREYAKLVDSGTDSTFAFKKALDGCGDSTKEYVNECIKQNKTTKEMVSGFNKGASSGRAFSSVIKTIGANLASLAINLGISLAISTIVNIVTKLASAEKELAEKTEQLNDEYSSSKKELAEYKKEISELHDVINDQNSSYDDAKAAREKLLKVQDDLISKYGSEQGAITDVTDAINGQIDALDRLSDRKWKQSLDEINQATDFKVLGMQLGGFIDWFNSRGGTLYDNKTDSIVRKMSDVSSYNPYINEFGGLGKYGYGAKGSGISLTKDDVKLLQELTKSYKNLSFKYNENHKSYELVGRDMQQFESDLQKLLTQTQKYEASDGLNKFLSRTLLNVSALNEGYGSFYDNYILNNKIGSSAEKSKALDDINAAVQEYKDAFNEGFVDETAQKEAEKKLVSIWGGAMQEIEDDADVVGYVERLYPDISHLVDRWLFNIHFKANTDGFKDDINDALELFKDASGGYLSSDDLILYDKNYRAGNVDLDDDRAKAYQALEIAANRYGLEVLDLIGILKEEKLLLSDDYQKLVDKYGEANIAALSPEDLAIAETYADTMFGSYDALLSKIAAVKEEQKQLNDEQSKMVSWASERDAALTKLGMASESNGAVTYDESWTKYLDTIKQLNPELASNQEEVEKCALANLQFSHAIDDLSKNFDSYKSALQDANALTPEYSNAINALADDLTYLTGINFNISEASNFLADANNLELLEQAINGSDEALQRLQQRAAEAIHISVDFSELEQLEEYTQIRIALGLDTEAFNADIQTFVTWLNENSDMGTIGVTAALDDNPFLQKLANVMSSSSEVAEAVKALFHSLGWDIDWDTKPMRVPKIYKDADYGKGKNYTTLYNGKNGGAGNLVNWDVQYEDIPVPTNIHFTPNGGSSSKKTSTSKYTPKSLSPSQKSSAASNLGKGSSGGSGGSSDNDAKEKEDDYKETIDFFERLIKVLDQQIDLLEAHLQDVVGAFAKNTLLDAQEDRIRQKMAGYTSAIEMYSAKASEALSKIPSDVAAKIQSGAVAIDEFVGEENKEVVEAAQEYEQWADKVADCKQQIVELREELRQLELQKFKNVAQDFQELFDVRQTQIDLISKAISLFESASDKIVGRGFYDVQIDQTAKQLDKLYEKRVALINQANSAMANGINTTVPCYSNVA